MASSRWFASTFLLLAWAPGLAPGCRCSQEPEIVSHETCCKEIGYALASRTVTCGEGAERGNEAFEQFSTSFSCNDEEPPLDAGPDAASAFVSIMDCVEDMLVVPCDLLVGAEGSLDRALTSSDACFQALRPGDGGTLLPPCPNEGQTRCGEACVYLQNDPDHCGACDRACPADHALNFGADCNEGTCAIRCLGNFLDCDNDEINGCEANRLEDVLHCLGCGLACPPATNPGQVARCEAGCLIECDETHLDCDSDPNNGCEVSVDHENCYACGADCSKGGLVVGVCRADVRGCQVLSYCPDGLLNCDDVDDCETASGTMNCGLCGVECPSPPNAFSTCDDGVCGTECFPGYLDCNELAADGCEVESAACP